MFLTEGSSNSTSATCCAQPRMVFHPELKETHQEVVQAEPAPSAITYIHDIFLKPLSNPTVRHPSLYLQLVETWTWKLQSRSNGMLGIRPAKAEMVKTQNTCSIPSWRGGGTQESCCSSPLNMRATLWSVFTKQVRPISTKPTTGNEGTQLVQREMVWRCF